MTNKKNLIAGLAVLALVIAAFLGGRAYSAARRPSFSGARPGGMAGTMPGDRGGMRGPGGTGFVSGRVISLDAQGFTVQLQNGSTQVVLASSSTVVTKSVSGTLEDVVASSTVTIQGSANADGSYTASSVQVR